MAGNQPISTSPAYANDELVAIRARADYMTLATASEQLAFGTDGVITSDSPWTLTSATIDFNAQGVPPNSVVFLTGPKNVMPGNGRLFAVDVVTPFTLSLRMLNQPPGVGQAPAGVTGATSITFTINTFASLIEDVSWNLKNTYAIDENTFYRSSGWIYRGIEDPYRDLRAATVLGVLIQAYSIENRVKDGDFWRKVDVFKKERQDVMERLFIKWGTYGNSTEPTSITSGRLSR